MVEPTTYPEGTLFALCILNPDNSEVSGVVRFVQEPGKKCKIMGEMKGLSPGLHGFHVHQFGKHKNNQTMLVLTLP